ncbi:MAG: hypothetical protein AAF328_08385 [Planctomycetota bacterium]
MSTDTPTSPPQANPTQANPTQAKASNFLANLNRFTARPEPTSEGREAAQRTTPTTPTTSIAASTAALPEQPAAKPVPIEAPAVVPPDRQSKAKTPRRQPKSQAKSQAEPNTEPKPMPQPQPQTPSKPRNPPPATSSAGTQLHRSFTVAPGTGTKVLTARVPRALHARLTLLATANKFADTDEHEQDFTTVNAIVMDALHHWLAKHDPQQNPPARSDAA